MYVCMYVFIYFYWFLIVLVNNNKTLNDILFELTNTLRNHFLNHKYKENLYIGNFYKKQIKAALIFTDCK